MEQENTVFFAKTRDVISPSRGNSKASGIDMFIPKINESFINDFKSKNPDISSLIPGAFTYLITEDDGVRCILVAPHARIVIPSGIIWGGKNGLSMNMHNKSGVSTKKGLVYGAEVVDVDYIGETHISLINTSPYIVQISEDEKIIQILQEPVILDNPVECTVTEITNIDTERGEGWAGSTN